MWGKKHLSIQSASTGKNSNKNSNGEQKKSPRKGRALAPFIAFLFIGFAVHLLVHQLNFMNLEGFPLGFYLAAQAAPILLATIAFWIASRHQLSLKADESVENDGKRVRNARFALKNGLSASGEFLSGAVIVGLAGVLFAQGYDGLAYMLGLMSALVVMSLFVVPAFANTPSRSLTQYLSINYSSRMLTVLGATTLGFCLILLLAAEITVVAVILTRSLAISFQNATFLAAVLTLLFVAMVNLKRNILPAGLALGSILLLVVLSLQSGLSSWEQFSFPLPQFSYGHALYEIVGLEQTLLEKELADAVTMKQHLRPRLHFDAVNFFAIISCLAFGFAVLPLRALFNGNSRPAGFSPSSDKATDETTVSLAQSSQALAWCAFFVCLTIITLPAVSAFSKLNLYKTISTPISISTLPSWVTPFSNSGLMKICGQTDLSTSNLTSTCSDQEGRLRLHDIVFQPDTLLSLAPDFANQPSIMILVLSLVIFLVALFGGSRLLTIAAAELKAAMTQEDLSSGNKRTTKENTLTTSATYIGFLVAATLFVTMSNLNTMTLISWSASLAASTLFPVIVVSHLWTRVSAPAAISAMIAGFAVWAYYIIGTTYFAPSFAIFWQAISSAPQWQLEELISLMAKCSGSDVGECSSLSTLAYESANWLGIQNSASAIFALPTALLVLIGLTFLIPRRT